MKNFSQFKTENLHNEKRKIFVMKKIKDLHNERKIFIIKIRKNLQNELDQMRLDEAEMNLR